MSNYYDRSTLGNIFHYGIVVPLKTAYLTGLAAIALNISVATFPGKELTETQAQHVIDASMHKQSLKGKKINLVMLPEKTLEKYDIGGGMYSSGGEFYLLFDKGNIHIKTLQHELAHVKYTQEDKEIHSLEEVLKYLDMEHSKGGSDVTLWSVLKYIYSPEEAACNVYAISHSGKHCIK